MKKITLDNRLQAAYDEINPCDCLVDVGSDHGKIPIAAVQGGKCQRAIAADISALSLNKARLAVTKYGVEDRVDCRVGDGLAVLKADEFDTVVIAGMGGLEITNILKGANGNRFKRYILLPQKNTVQLREYLMRDDLCPEQDYMVECNNKYYSLIVAVHGKYLPSALELKYGKSRNTPIFGAFITKKIAELQATLACELPYDTRQKSLIELGELKDVYESITNC